MWNIWVQFIYVDLKLDMDFSYSRASESTGPNFPKYHAMSSILAIN